jgi:hypothetical protein
MYKYFIGEYFVLGLFLGYMYICRSSSGNLYLKELIRLINFLKIWSRSQSRLVVFQPVSHGDFYIFSKKSKLSCNRGLKDM